MTDVNITLNLACVHATCIAVEVGNDNERSVDGQINGAPMDVGALQVSFKQHAMTCAQCSSIVAFACIQLRTPGQKYVDKYAPHNVS